MFVKAVFIQLRDFRNIRQFLTHDAVVSVANAYLVVGWTTVTHFSGVSPNSILTDYSLSKIVQLELLQIRVNILK